MMMVKKGRKSDISVLGEELLVEILCRLGCVKYATQCKSVCKFWCSLVKADSYWVQRWIQMNHEIKDRVTLITPCMDYCGREVPTVWVDLNFLPCFNGKNPIHVLGSRMDLLLCCPNFSDRSCYYLCNPFTKQWTALPPPPPLGKCHPAQEGLQASLSIRPKVEFILDERAEKFTVVRIIPDHVLPFCNLYDEKLQISFFSSSDGRWREVEDGGGWREMFQGTRSCRNIVSYKGSLVWLMREAAFSPKLRLYSWDLHSNYTRFPFTPGYQTNTDQRYSNISTIGVCEGRLRIAQLLDDYRKLVLCQFDDGRRQNWDTLQELDFSRLGEDSNDWSMAISLYELDQGFVMNVAEMVFHPLDGDILYMHVNFNSCCKAGSTNIFMCNLKERRLELMRNLPTDVWRVKLHPLVRHCWPTLVPLLQP